jgi:hypothetical protein
MKILVACEESQKVTIAFRNKGHEAYSCDIIQCSGGKPEWHILGDCREAIKSKIWDLIILHCPCTYTALCGNRWYYNSPLRKEGIEFCKECYLLALSVCKNVVLEQPKTIMQKYIGKKTQKIQPYEYGHRESKETWLWINGLPILKPTKIIKLTEGERYENQTPTGQNNVPPGPERGKIRSKTYQGIAEAMAQQWG